MDRDRRIARIKMIFHSPEQAEEGLWRSKAIEAKIIGKSTREFRFMIEGYSDNNLEAICASTRCGGKFMYYGSPLRIGIQTLRHGRGGVLSGTDLVGLRRDVGFVFRSDQISGYDISESARTNVLFIDLKDFDRVLERHFGTPQLLAWRGIHPFRLDSRFGRLIETANQIFDENHDTAPGCLYSETSIKLIKEALIVSIADLIDGGFPSKTRSSTIVVSKNLVQRAVDIIRTQEVPLTIHDLADALQIGVRALQAGFRTHVGSPPHLLLRLGRIEGAHRDLKSGAAPTVGDAARKWGFSNAGRFAGEYFAAMGEFPSDTLARRRR